MKYALVLLMAAGCGSSPSRVSDAAAEPEEVAPDAGPAEVSRPRLDGSLSLDAAAMLADAAPAADSGSAPDLASAADGPGEAGAPPLAGCARPSVDHLEIWEAHGGSLRPGVGANLFVKSGDRYQVKVDFLPGGEWHEIVVPLVNSLTRKTDLSASKGFTLRYSATADLHVQLRPLSHAHGGEQWTAKLPSTGGALQEFFVPFSPEAWGMLLGTPPFPFSQALGDANFFNFIGPPGTANSVVFDGLRIDAFVPPCS
jgi:hypothetical protein